MGRSSVSPRRGPRASRNGLRPTSMCRDDPNGSLSKSTRTAQSADAIVYSKMGPMLDDLEAICQQEGVTLHYMTAREAYNVAKAAEAGLSGNPEDYRDYKIPKPRNMLFPASLSEETSVPAVLVDSLHPLNAPAPPNLQEQNPEFRHRSLPT